MALKIDVNVSGIPEFQRQYQLLEQYEKLLSKQARIWPSLYSGQQDNVKQALKTADDIVQQFGRFETVASGPSKFITTAQKVGTSFKQLGSDIKSTLGNLVTYALNPLSILFPSGMTAGMFGIGAGLLGLGLIGGGGIVAYGLHSLYGQAEDVMARRRTALGLGVSYGALTAFDVQYGARFGVGQQELEATAGGLSDITTQQNIGLRSAGVPLSGSNAADAILKVMDSLPGKFAGLSQGEYQRRLNDLGFSGIIDIKQLVRILSANPKQKEEIRKEYEEQRKAFEVSPDILQKWTDFVIQLKSAGVQIETILVKGLTGNGEGGIISPLTKMSQNVVRVIDGLAKSPEINKDIGKVKDGLTWFVSQVGSDSFQRDVTRFVSGMEALSNYFEVGGLL